MTKFVFVNGEYVPESQANISVFDRGFLFADAIYEVVAFINGRLIDNERHLERMESSLQKINLTNPAKKGAIIDIQKGLIKRNGLSEGTVYIQISRGTAIRDFSFPNPASPSLVAFTQEKTIEHPLLANKGATVNLLPEIRWARRDIKTVGLLAQSMAKQTALDNGADDAWLVEKGFITEGSSSNAFIVDADGTIITHELSSSILPGITRQAVLDIADHEGIRIEERPISTEETSNAAEAFSTSASTLIMPIVQIDGHRIGTGRPGEMTTRLRDLYLEKYVYRTSD